MCLRVRLDQGVIAGKFLKVEGLRAGEQAGH